jgi:hypothetical protein
MKTRGRRLEDQEVIVLTMSHDKEGTRPTKITCRVNHNSAVELALTRLKPRLADV